ncbi:MAG: prolipoprotein diacylglyceryl transferase [Bacillota bacterium]
MRRVLFELGPVHINTFGLTIALGVLVALFLAHREARRKGLDPDRILDFALYALIGGIIGARLLYILLYNPAFYLQNPMKVFAIQQGGLSIHGALLGGLLATLWFVRKHKISFWRLADTVAPSLALGQAIGRVGCDVFGVPMLRQWPWGVPVNGQLLHPAQVYEFLLNYGIFFFLWRRRQKNRYDGELFLTYVILYSLTRGIVELFRSNPVLFGPFSVAHGVSLLFVVVAVVAMHYLRSTSLRGSAPLSAAAGDIVKERPLLQALVVLAMMLISMVLYYVVR